MVPTLNGRIQTRLFLLAVIGLPVTVAIAPFLPTPGSTAERFVAASVVLLTIAVLGVGWELLYQVLMQWRWEKDWPTLFGLLTAVPEGLLAGWAATSGRLPVPGGSVSVAAFVLHFALVWLAVWLVANGPMRVPFVRWRFHGGRVL